MVSVTLQTLPCIRFCGVLAGTLDIKRCSSAEFAQFARCFPAKLAVERTCLPPNLGADVTPRCSRQAFLSSEPLKLLANTGQGVGIQAPRRPPLQHGHGSRCRAQLAQQCLRSSAPHRPPGKCVGRQTSGVYHSGNGEGAVSASRWTPLIAGQLPLRGGRLCVGAAAARCQIGARGQLVRGSQGRLSARHAGRLQAPARDSAAQCQLMTDE